LNRRLPPCFFESQNNNTTDTLDFGEVTMGTTARDTAHVVEQSNATLGAVWATPPFQVPQFEAIVGAHFIIPVSITPTQPIEYFGFLSVSTSLGVHLIVLRATGIVQSDVAEKPGGSTGNSIIPSANTLSASPNPFNLSTTIIYSLSQPGPAQILLFDLLGREVRRYELPNQSAGQHSLMLNGDGLANGMYILQFSTGAQCLNHKLLLLK
jgi:hypothetical protein